MKFEVTILGSNSAIPAYGRHPTAQILNYNESLYLIDCGEGTQMRLGDFGFRRSRIGHIFISHLHGDHFFGLIGLLTTNNLLGHYKPLHLYAHEPLRDLIYAQLQAAGTILKYPLQFHPIEPDKVSIIHETDILRVITFPLDHKIACQGFLFEEKPKLRKFVPEKAAPYDIPVEQIPAIKQGADFIAPDGTRVKNEWLTEDPTPPRKYAYVTDTAPLASIVPVIRSADLLYHEATFLQESAHRAGETHHSTAEEAAAIAQDAGVKQLLIGHYSAKYRDLQPLLYEAREVFPETELAIEGKTYTV